MKFFQRINSEYAQKVVYAIFIGMAISIPILHSIGAVYASMVVGGLLAWIIISNALMFKSWLKTFDAMIFWSPVFAAIIGMIYVKNYNPSVVGEKTFLYIFIPVVALGVMYALYKKQKDKKKRLGK